MLERISKTFVEKLLRKKVISEDDVDVYCYGFFQLMMLLLNVGTSMVLAILFQAIVPCIMVNLSYIPLRVCAGGHHASSPARCYTISTIMAALLLSIIKWVPIHHYIAIGMLVFADDPFDAVERNVYRMRSISVLLIEILAYVLSLIFCKKMFADSIVLGLFTESIMLLLGKLKLKANSL